MGEQTRQASALLLHHQSMAVDGFADKMADMARGDWCMALSQKPVLPLKANWSQTPGYSQAPGTILLPRNGSSTSVGQLDTRLESATARVVEILAHFEATDGAKVKVRPLSSVDYECRRLRLSGGSELDRWDKLN